MKSSSCLLVSLLAAGIFFSGCQKSVPGLRVNSEPDLSALKGKIIYQFSFENNNSDTSFKGWVSPWYSFSKDVPPGGGAWSLQLAPGWIPRQGYAEHYEVLDTGTYQLKFSCYTKVMTNGTFGVAYLRLIKRSATSTTNKILVEKSFTNTNWERHSVATPVRIQPGDFIVIQVSAGAAELATWQTLFDNVVLMKQ